MRHPSKGVFAHALPIAMTITLMTALTACGGSKSTADKEPPPATVEDIPGSAVHKLILTARAAQRLGIQTQPLLPGGIAAAAVMYDNDGRAWTYTSPAPLTFVRAPVSIGVVKNEVAALVSGPAPGTQVVTIGSAELFGLEYGVGGEQ